MLLSDDPECVMNAAGTLGTLVLVFQMFVIQCSLKYISSISCSFMFMILVGKFLSTKQENCILFIFLTAFASNNDQQFLLMFALVLMPST